MKKRTKIILTVVLVLLGTAGYFGYTIYQSVMGSEKIEGVEAIPEVAEMESEIEYGLDDWPNWRGVTLDGKSKTEGIKKDWSEGLKKIWQVDYLCQGKATGSWSSVVVKGNRLMVPGRDELNDLLFCLNAETGDLIWTASYEAEALTPHGKGARGTPFIDHAQVYTFGRSGDLVCWRLLDGELLWRTNTTEIGGVEPDWGYSISPFIFKDLVIVQGGGSAQIVAYDKFSGELAWKSQEGKAGFSSAMPIDLEGEAFLLIYHGMGLSLINPNDGEELWEIPWETDYGVNATTPIVKNDTVFFTSGYGMGSQAIKAGKEDYEILWTNPGFAAQHSDPILIDGYLYGYSGQSTRNKGEFKCIEFASGKEMWSTNEMGNGTTVYVDGHLICMDYKANLFLVQPNPKAFKLIGEMEKAIEGVRHLAWTPPTVANGKLYLRYLQKLYCFDLMP